MTPSGKMSFWGKIALAAVVLLSFALHLWRIEYPDQAVFDEVHFATYAADLVSGEMHYDIHPVLGKVFYGAVLAVTAPLEAEKRFLEFADGELKIAKTIRDFGFYPYVYLRLLGATFGVGLIVAFYFFLRNIGLGEVGATLGALAVALDNALLLETRLILLNGMYLAFAFAALAVFARKRPMSILAGVLWGLSLSIKYIGIIFAPVFFAIYVLRRKTEWKISWAQLAMVGVFGGLVLCAALALPGIFYSTTQRINFWRQEGLATPEMAAKVDKLPAIEKSLVVDLVDAANGAIGYTAISSSSETLASEPAPLIIGGSKWYEWPLMQGSFPYYIAPDQSSLILVGNPVLWAGGSAAIIFITFLLARHGVGRVRKRRGVVLSQNLFVPMVTLAGYVSGLFLYATVVERDAYLYHYFPALLFSFAALAWFCEEAVGVKFFKDLNRQHGVIFGALVMLAVAGFVYAAPTTFGFRWW